MNKKALYYALIYSAIVIAVKYYILYGGYSLSRFGYFYSHITLAFLIIPFYIPAIAAKRRENGGFISGRESFRIALTVFAVSAIFISIYNYFEFEYSGKALAIEYYNSNQFLDFLKSQTKIKADEYGKIIQEQVKLSEESGFRATTGKLFSMMLVGLSGAFIVSVLMKRAPAKA